jgi:hypothetical protein
VITNITGTRNGQAITSLFGTGGQIAYTPAHNYIFDNLLYVGYAGAVPYVDLGGLEYTTGTGGNTQYFNVYTNPASNAGFTYFENLTALTKLSITQVSGGSPGSGVAPVPLPAALPLFGSAIAGLGGFNWLRRRRKDRSQA